MSIIGIETLVYGVDDVDQCTKFFSDFGLPLAAHGKAMSLFQLDEGSKVELRRAADLSYKSSCIRGAGVQEVVWGVDSADELEALVADLRTDHKLRWDDDGTVHFVPHFGIPMALRVFARRPVLYAPDPLNAPGHVRRLNQHRKWRARARPKAIQHVVYQCAGHERAAEFMCERLGFRVTDVQENFGIYLRAGGTHNHHNLFLLDANAPVPGCDGQTRFHHANFVVEDIDELMVGVNHLQRQGWAPSQIGLGRHRIDSALFYYVPCPAGGEAEYGADSDCVDDSWVPRRWTEPLFGYAHFTHNLPPFLQVAPPWKVEYLDETPAATGGARRPVSATPSPLPAAIPDID